MGKERFKSLQLVHKPQLGSGGIKKDEKLIKDQGFCQTGKLYYTIVLNYRKMDVSV